MKVVLADIEQKALEAAVGRVQVISPWTCSASSPTSPTSRRSAACSDQALERYGQGARRLPQRGSRRLRSRPACGSSTSKDWEWGLAVNVWGVIHGIKALLPVMIDQQDEGHVVITSSSVGVIAPTPNGGIYNMTKAADLSLAESLYGQLRNMGSLVSASVLVPPGTINTGLFTSNRNRQAHFEPETPRLQQPTLTYDEMLRRMNASGNPRQRVEPVEVAEYVVDGITNGTFWILPDKRHPDVQTNFDAIIKGRSESMLQRTDPMNYMQKAT